MSPARHYTRAEQAEIRRRQEARMNPVVLPAPPPVQLDAETSTPFPDSFFTALNLVLTYGAAQNLGPTRCARLNYLWFVTAAMAYQWTQPATESRLTGTKDRWDWNRGMPLATNKDQYVWMNHAWEAVMPLFVPTYEAGTLLAKERLAQNWTEEQQAAEWTRIQAEGDWQTFWTTWQTWWQTRQEDGSVAAAVPPTAAQLPNGETVLDVAGTVDPATFPNPDKWTPLKVGASVQNYLTYNWLSVRSSASSGEDDAIVMNAAKRLFPTDPLAKREEIAEVVAISQALTDAQKVSAEFWAGGPNTVSPPGMMIWFWRAYMQSAGASADWSTIVYSGLDLAARIFETSRLVWGVKKQFMEARPIQYIRQFYRGQPLKLFDGRVVMGEEWVPYQEAIFVCPPFADFPSGHSAFSQSFANVMTEWFGPEIPAVPYTAADLSLLSPALPSGEQKLVLGTWAFPAGASYIQKGGTVPTQSVTFTYHTWQDLANDAGLSRKYGGIHATSAHVGSQALANALHERIKLRWKRAAPKS